MSYSFFPKAFLTGLVMLCFFSASAEIKDSIGVTKINNILMVRYLVEPGETIYGISTRYHVPVSNLLELNPELENGLKVGQVINIPYNEELVQKQKAKQNGNMVVHKVQPGETLYSLSRKYGVSVEQLMKLNNMDLKAGQEIVIGDKDQVKETSKEAAVTQAPSTKEEPLKMQGPRQEPEKPKEESKPAPVAEAKPAPAPAAKPAPKSTSKPAEVAKTEPVPAAPASNTYPFDPDMQQILIIPFDPYLYFSDADHEIAAKSRIAPTKVREIFRRRMTALMQMPGYESIFLLGGRSEDSISDLNKIYSSVSYHYQQVLDNPNFKEVENGNAHISSNTSKSWFDKQKDKIVAPANQTGSFHDKHEGQYFGVKIRNPEEFFGYFATKYSVDYYIFVNQFEVKTNYENCLDRAAHNFERTFTTHFSIFDAEGNQVAGNKFKTFYNSNSSYIYTIVADNMDKISKRILAELPPPGDKP